MEERLYQLMHRDDPVCTVSIDPIFGAMLRVSQKKESELLPPGGTIDTQTLRKWWQRRAVPIGQGRIRPILAQMGMATTQEFLVRNLGLSLSNQSWKIENIRLHPLQSWKCCYTLHNRQRAAKGVFPGFEHLTIRSNSKSN